MTNPTPNSLCPQGEHAPGPEPLSTAAMAVLDAFLNGCICNSVDNSVAFQADRNGLAAALRALVLKCEYCDDYGTVFIDPKDILAIATKLKGTNDQALFPHKTIVRHLWP